MLQWGGGQEHQILKCSIIKKCNFFSCRDAVGGNLKGGRHEFQILKFSVTKKGKSLNFFCPGWRPEHVYFDNEHHSSFNFFFYHRGGEWPQTPPPCLHENDTTGKMYNVFHEHVYYDNEHHSSFNFFFITGGGHAPRLPPPAWKWHYWKNVQCIPWACVLW